jgi:hypothetical protein
MRICEAHGAQIAQEPSSQNAPTTLRLTANEFAAPPAAIDCHQKLRTRSDQLRITGDGPA